MLDTLGVPGSFVGLSAFAGVPFFVGVGAFIETQHRLLRKLSTKPDPVPRLPCDGDSWVEYIGNKWKPAPALAVRRVAPPPSVVPPLVLEMTHGGTLKDKSAASIIGGRFDPVLSSVAGSYRLVNSMPLYKLAGRPNVSLSLHASGKWLVQEGPDFGTDRAFFSLADPTCALPHLSTETWMAWNGSQLQDEHLLRAVRADAIPKRKREDEPPVKTEESGKAKAPRASSSGGGIAEAHDDREVTDVSNAAAKEARGRAAAEDVDDDDDD